MLYLLGVVAFALTILISVSLHEAGHMLTAKRFGMKVTRYFVGFGPTIFSFRRGETEYGLKAIPLGGFCKIVGMTPQDDDVAPADQPRAMWRFPVWKRTIVMSAGSITHFVLAIVALWFAAAYVGLPNPDYPASEEAIRKQPAVISLTPCVVLQSVDRPCAQGDPASPAQAAGLRDGDRITAINGTPVTTWGETLRVVRSIPPGPATVDYLRDGRADKASVQLAAVQRPPLDNPAGPAGTVAAMGVSVRVLQQPIVTYGALDAFGATADYTRLLAIGTVESLQRIPEKIPALWASITGSERDPETPISVVGASRLGGEAVERGLWELFVLLFISLNFFIGVFNLLPLLPLDGGHIAIAWFERIRSLIYVRLGRPDPGRVDYFKLMPVTYMVILIGGAFTLLTITADVINPITLISR